MTSFFCDVQFQADLIQTPHYYSMVQDNCCYVNDAVVKIACSGSPVDLYVTQRHEPEEQKWEFES